MLITKWGQAVVNPLLSVAIILSIFWVGKSLYYYCPLEILETTNGKILFQLRTVSCTRISKLLVSLSSLSGQARMRHDLCQQRNSWDRFWGLYPRGNLWG